MYVLDTNILIYFFKGKGNVATKLFQTSTSDIYIPTIVLYELEVGIAKSASPQKRTQQLATLLTAVNVLPFSEREAKSAAQIRVSLERSGMVIGPYDILIAATALANRAVLVTHNTREFSRVKNLHLEDWY